MSAQLSNNLTQMAVRHFSAQIPRQATKTQQVVATAIISTAVVLPFIPPAIESKRERERGQTSKRQHYAPLCCHA